jgi:hypothetical protein
MKFLCWENGVLQVVSSSRNFFKKGVRSNQRCIKVDDNVQKWKKVNGMLRHPIHSLKKVERLHIQDRKAVMKILKKKGCKFQGSAKLKKAVKLIFQELSDKTSSSGSANTDWKHWVVVHGSV